MALEDASTTKKGIVQLSSATNSTSETLAATPKAVKAAYDNAEKRLQKDQNGADIPDMRGWTIKGKPASGRAVLSQEQDGIKSHTHSASASSTDLGTKTTSSFDYCTKSTNNTGAHTHSVSGTAASAGAHTHSMTFVSGGSSGAPGSGSPDYSKYSVNTSSAGAHTHSVAIGSHGHTITVNAAGNAENTVKNIAFNYIVRLA